MSVKITLDGHLRWIQSILVIRVAGHLLFSHFDQLLGHITAYITVLSCSQVTLVHGFVVGQAQFIGNFSLHVIQSVLRFRNDILVTVVVLRTHFDSPPLYALMMRVGGEIYSC